MFLDIPTWFENATAWSRAPKMVLSKYAYHISPTEVKISNITIVNFGVPLISIQLSLALIK